MELLKRNIHMDRIRNRNTIQFTLEEDRNIPDAKPDAVMIISDAGELVLEEVKAQQDFVHVKGKLCYQILYAAPDEAVPVIMKGEIPFEEQLHADGVKSTDVVVAEGQLEDVTTNLINSRKISLQSVVTITSWVRELYDEETATAITSEFPVEYNHKSTEVLQTAIQKKDIFRIKEEFCLPREMPNLVQILWKQIRMEQIEWKPCNEKIELQGQLAVFVLYESMDDENPVQIFQTVQPFHGMIDCQGSDEDGILDMECTMSHKELEIHGDNDEEERCLGLDVVLDLSITMYRKETLEILTDVYGVNKQVKTEEKEAVYRKLLAHTKGKQKLIGRVKCTNAADGVRRILFTDGEVHSRHQEITEQGITVNGTVEYVLLYETGNKEIPYHSVKGSIPFTYTCEAAGVEPTDYYLLQTRMETADASMLDSEEAEVRATVAFELLAFQEKKENIIDQITVEELDMEEMSRLPGMAVYVVQDGDTLWKIGKKYFVSVTQLKEMNGLTGNEIRKGDKLLIVKNCGDAL